MDLERWRRIRELSEACAERPAAEREAWLDTQESDPALRVAVQALLAEAEAGADEVSLDPIRVPGDVGGRPASGTGETLGAWRLLEPIGEGGMGRVFLAERAEGGFRQEAAIKRLRFGFDAGAARARFEAERQILARLEHPNIARLLDGGCDAQGSPWLALEYVRGSDILSHCDARRLGLVERLRLFRSVCAAVAQAHRQLVVHRDIKPSNVMVSEAGTVKLLDFGVAKLLEAGDDPGLTGSRLAPLTPAYAAPEQLRGEPASTQTDVYGLGLLLYQLLTGLLPHRGRSGVSAEAVSEVLTQEPAPPSAALRRLAENPEQRERIAAARCTRPQALTRALRGDIDAVLLRALRSRAQDRYDSVEQFDADIANVLAQRPVSARRGTQRYRLQRFVLRHRLPVALACLLLMALLGGLVHSLLQAQRITSERDRALVEQRRASAALAFQQEIFRQANPSHHGGSEPSASELLKIGERLLEADPLLEPSVRALMLEELAKSYRGMGDSQQALELAGRAADAYRSLGDRDGQLRSDVFIANALHARGELAQAEQRVGAILEANPGLLLPDETRAAALHLRGIILGNRGEMEPALADLAEAANLRLASAGASDSAYLESAAVAVFMLGASQRYEEAEASLSHIDARVRAERVPTAQTELALVSAWANLREQEGRLDAASELAETRLKLLQRIFGDDHPNTAFGQVQLGTLAMRRYDNAAALRWFEQALSIRERSQGPNAGSVATLRTRLAIAHFRLGDLDAAEQQIERAVRDIAAARGLGSGSLGAARATWVLVLHAQGRLAQAAAEAVAMEADGGSAWESLDSATRYRMLSTVALQRAADGSGDCLEIDGYRAQIDVPTRRAMIGLYLVDCLYRSARLQEARSALASIEREQLPNLGFDPVLRGMREAAEGLGRE